MVTGRVKGAVMTFEGIEFITADGKCFLIPINLISLMSSVLFASSN